MDMKAMANEFDMDILPNPIVIFAALILSVLGSFFNLKMISKHGTKLVHYLFGGQLVLTIISGAMTGIHFSGLPKDDMGNPVPDVTAAALMEILGICAFGAVILMF